MASIIKIKRSGTSGAPSALRNGEMVYSYADHSVVSGGDRLYIGTGTETAGVAANIEVIGGSYFTDKLDHALGVLTASSALLVDANSKIDNLKVRWIFFFCLFIFFFALKMNNFSVVYRI